MCPAVASGIVARDAPDSYWPIFFPLSLVNVPEVFVKVNSTLFLVPNVRNEIYPGNAAF